MEASGGRLERVCHPNLWMGAGVWMAGLWMGGVGCKGGWAGGEDVRALLAWRRTHPLCAHEHHAC